MNLRILSFTEKGFILGTTVAGALGGEAERCREGGLQEWTSHAFLSSDALIFVGAAGIAVRAIAPFVRSKTADPAVLVVDETGQFVIPILSGHLGGANALALRVAEILGATPVLTTATDREGVFAVDTWGKEQNCAVLNPGKIKTVSARLLKGENVKYYSEFPIAGAAPEQVLPGTEEEFDFALTVHKMDADALYLVPKIVTLGIGCKKGTSVERIKQRVEEFLKKNRLCPSAVFKVCSIDLKKDEEGILKLCEEGNWAFETYSAEQLKEVRGKFTVSAFVQETVGVDNVCERASVLGSGGQLLIPKDAAEGVTIAAALKPYFPNWNKKI